MQGSALKPLIVAAVLLLVAGCGGGGGGGFGGGTVTPPPASSSSSSSSTSTSSSSSSSSDPQYLPAVSLTTVGAAAIADKDNYVDGTFALAAAGANPAVSDTMGIKLHGNSTLMFPKLPYRVKLDDKEALLGMPKDKNWVLLANYSDKTLIRNSVAMEISRRLGAAWTPRSLPVEVTLNGQYEGAYDLFEQVRIAKDRINITQIDDTFTGDPADGGYLVELNERMDDPVCWRTTRGVAVCLKDPDPSTTAESDYIKTYIQAAEDSLFSATPTDPATGYEAYFDVDALIDWYLTNELFKNVDSDGYNSVYLYKDARGRLKFGPVWDFDLGAGNTDYFDASPQGFRTATGVWIAQMKAVDPTFEARIRARWDALKASQIDTVPAYIDLEAAAMEGAEQRNFQQWPILNTYVWPNSEVAGSYAGEVAFFRGWMVARIAWLDANL